MGPAGTPACPTSVCPPRFAYKDEYEKFKLYLTIILIVISFTCRFLLNSRWVRCSGLGPCPPFQALAPTLCPLLRVTDAAFNFLLVWYYCTLTIRESILINNGSRWARGRGGCWSSPGRGCVPRAPEKQALDRGAAFFPLRPCSLSLSTSPGG